MLAGGLALAACAAPPSQPNVLLIVIDTLRRDGLGIYGASRPTSPVIDSLAARSIIFDRAVSTGDNTVLSHSALFSGRYPQLGQREPGASPTIAEAFKEDGYATYGVAANPLLAAAGAWSRGFDRYTSQPVPKSELPAGQLDHARYVSVRSADHTINRVLEMLGEHLAEASGRPWFMFVNILDPHDPYNGGRQWREAFRRSPSDLDGILRRGSSQSLWEWVAAAAATLSEDDIRRLRELYDAEIRFVDSQLERLFEFLGESEQSDDTVVVVTSDHGELLGEHGLFTHALGSYEAELSIPLILHVPWRDEQGRRLDQTAESIDVAPTLLALAGIARPASFVGRVLVSRDGRIPDSGPDFTYHFHHPSAPGRMRELGFGERSHRAHVSLRAANFKLILLDTGRLELLDLRGTGDERNGLAVAEVPGLLNSPGQAVPDSAVPEEYRQELEDALRGLGYIE